MATENQEERFPRADADAVMDASPSGITTTAARALILGASLTGSDALIGIEEDLAGVGVESLPGYWGGWEERLRVVEQSDRTLAERGLLAELRDQERPGSPPVAEQGASPERGARADLWREVAANPSPELSVAFLRLLMTDREPIASAAAAVALSRWQRTRGFVPPDPLIRAKELSRLNLESPVALARQIASAALAVANTTSPPETSRSVEAEPEPSTSVSTMVHGTWAWIGDWWYPGGDFHTYVKSHLRPDVYSGGQAYSWSGRYRTKDRAVAAERLARWADEARPGGLNTVFAHSYGGIIALHATTYGLRAENVVQLSVPAEAVAVEWRHVTRAISLRIHLDLMLLAARRRQRFTENVEECYLPWWFVRHDDAHSPEVWADLHCARMLRL